MKRFGSSIRYILVDLINIYKKDPNDFEFNRDKYLREIGESSNSYFYSIDSIKIDKIISFIDKYVDSLTCENEMKMECYFNQDEPAFIGDKVNTKLFNFLYADKIYNFAQENNLDLRIHTILWYRHVPKQLTEYLENRNDEDKKRLTLEFIKSYMECLAKRYPNAYCVDVINEMAMDPDEIYWLEKEGEQVYEYDDEGIRKDYWYNVLGKHYYVKIFKMARDIFGSNVKLFYNDNNEGNKQKQQIYLKVFSVIREYEKKANIKILDGFGMQSHYWGSIDESKEFMEDLFSFYTSTGLEIQITEFDVSNHSNKIVQDEIFNNFADVVGKYNIDSFTMWGLNDMLSWISEYDPLLVDANGNFKAFTKKYLQLFSNKMSNNTDKNRT